jgi:hypothetical protein
VGRAREARNLMREARNLMREAHQATTWPRACAPAGPT